MASTGPTAHSIVGMSVMERRAGCPGSAAAEEGLGDRPSAAAERGTRLHEAAARALLEGKTGEDVWTEDEEGAEIIDAYLDIVLSVHHRLGGVLLVEHRFNLTDIHPDLFGTADAVIVAPPVVAVVDLKSGRGVRVRARDANGRANLQLTGYGLGGMTAAAAGQRVTALEVHVVQPLVDGHTEAVMDADEIMDMAGDIAGIVEAALAPNAPRIAGDHCRFCRAAAMCDTLRNAAWAATQATYADVAVEGAEALPVPRNMTSAELGTALAAADIMETWADAVRQYATGELVAGREVVGQKIVRKFGRRTWIKDADFVAKYVGSLGFDPWAARKLLTPAQMEAAAKKHAKATDTPLALNLTGLADTPERGVVMVPISDPRPAIASGATTDFAGLSADDPLA